MAGVMAVGYDPGRVFARQSFACGFYSLGRTITTAQALRSRAFLPVAVVRFPSWAGKFLSLGPGLIPGSRASPRISSPWRCRECRYPKRGHYNLRVVGCAAYRGKRSSIFKLSFSILKIDCFNIHNLRGLSSKHDGGCACCRGGGVPPANFREGLRVMQSSLMCEPKLCCSIFYLCYVVHMCMRTVLIEVLVPRL